jgi:hypothetical protein
MTHFDFICLGYTFGDANDQSNLVLYRLNDGVGGTRWGNVYDGRVWLCFPDSL